MNRRRFLQLGAAAAIGLAVPPFVACEREPQHATELQALAPSASRFRDLPVNDDGISLRLVRLYDVQSEQFVCRMDVLYGMATLRPELACRVSA